MIYREGHRRPLVLFALAFFCVSCSQGLSDRSAAELIAAKLKGKHDWISFTDQGVQEGLALGFWQRSRRDRYRLTSAGELFFSSKPDVGFDSIKNRITTVPESWGVLVTGIQHGEGFGLPIASVIFTLSKTPNSNVSDWARKGFLVYETQGSGEAMLEKHGDGWRVTMYDLRGK